MSRAALLPAIVLVLALAIPAQAAEPFIILEDILNALAPPQQQAPPPQEARPPQQAPETAPPASAPATPPIHMDQALAREHQRFTQFATDQMHKMNANIIGGKQSMQVQKHGKGQYRASYKAIDVEGIICQVRRSESNPNYYVGSVLYKEYILESVAETPETCRKGEFVRVSEKQSRIIYSSKHGGGWE